MIPLSTGTITVTRVEDAAGVDPYDPPAAHPAPTTIASGVRAVLTPPSATTKLSGGTRVDYVAQLRCDTTAMLPGDAVTDSETGLVWTVLWATQTNALGLAFTRAELKLVEGAT
ncbi:MAG: hypothetical protein JWO62_2635 [Acidimicrobiaceae bacterium]|nr:hypothetical protein [Acidimicrobiaceae bacterium]